MVSIRRVGTAHLIPILGFIILILIVMGAEADDSFEENDDLANAAPIEPGVYADLNSSDPDYYLLNCTTTGLLRITLWYPHDTGEVGLFLLYPNGTIVGSSESSSGEERLEASVLEGEQYIFEVRNRTQTEYHMAVVNGNEASWTFSVYMDGDNTLNDNMEPDLEEMREAGSGGGLHIPVLKDGDGSKDSSIVYVRDGYDVILPTYVVNRSWSKEINMGDPETLAEWLRWCYLNFDTGGRMALDLWDHGKGVWGCCWDSQSGDDLLTLEDIRSGIEESWIEDNLGVIELLGSDSCLMQVVELSHEVSHLARYFIASQEDEPKDGWDYGPFLKALSGNLSWTGQELGMAMVDSYIEEYGADGDETLSVISLEDIPSLSEALKNLSLEFSLNIDVWADEIRAARDQTRDFNNYYADVKDFSLNLLQRTDNDTVVALIGAVMEGIERAIVYEDHGEKRYDSHGMSIYFPKSGYDTEYDSITFSLDTGWGDFLQGWIPVPGGPTDHFERMLFYERDNDSDESNDTILVMFKPFSDKQNENVLILIELINATGHAILSTHLNTTLQFDEADYYNVYLNLPENQVPAEYRARASLYDSDGNRDDVRTSSPFVLHPFYETPPLPSPPVIEIVTDHGDPALINEGETIQFGITVVSGVPSFFQWDFDGDGEGDWNSTSEGKVNHTYIVSGNYSAYINVSDQWGREANRTIVVRVNAIPEIFVADQIIANPGVVILNISALDPDGEIILYEWDLDGDGSFEGSSFSFFANESVYNEPGDHLGIFRVTDSGGAVRESTVVIHINHGPRFLGELIVDVVGDKVTLRVIAWDTDGEIVSYHWDLDGDGIEEAVTEENVTFFKLAGGEHIIKVGISDDLGLWEYMTGTITVDSPPEIKVLTDDGIPIAGSNITYLSGDTLSLRIEIDANYRTDHQDAQLQILYDEKNILSESFLLGNGSTETFFFRTQLSRGTHSLRIILSAGDHVIFRNLTIQGSEDSGKERFFDPLFDSPINIAAVMLIFTTIIILLCIIVRRRKRK